MSSVNGCYYAVIVHNKIQGTSSQKPRMKSKNTRKHPIKETSLGKERTFAGEREFKSGASCGKGTLTKSCHFLLYGEQETEDLVK